VLSVADAKRTSRSLGIGQHPRLVDRRPGARRCPPRPASKSRATLPAATPATGMVALKAGGKVGSVLA
jgi:hypothetical protein